MSRGYNKTNKQKVRKMERIIQSVRIRADRAKALKEKAIELTGKKRDYIKETDLINYLIDDCLENLDVDSGGIFIIETDVKESQK